MELWIRSQDKTFLKKVNTIGIVEGDNKWFISESVTVDFGEYETEERALEVLDEIQKLLTPISEILTISSKNIDSLVYEMPKE